MSAATATATAQITGPLQPGDTAEFTLVTGPAPGREETRVGFIQSVRANDNGSLSVAYRYASNPRGITWSAYIRPEHVAGIRILERDPNADLGFRSMLPA